MKPILEPLLGVNIDHIAIIRQNRLTRYPDPIQAAFEAERERWIATGQANYNQEAEIDAVNNVALEIPVGHQVVSSHVAGNLWQIKVGEGDVVQEGDVLMIVESMKMEISITATCSGKVSKVLRSEGGAVSAGQNLILIAEEK